MLAECTQKTQADFPSQKGATILTFITTGKAMLWSLFFEKGKGQGPTTPLCRSTVRICANRTGGQMFSQLGASQGKPGRRSDSGVASGCCTNTNSRRGR